MGKNSRVLNSFSIKQLIKYTQIGLIISSHKRKNMMPLDSKLHIILCHEGSMNQNSDGACKKSAQQCIIFLFSKTYP